MTIHGSRYLPSVEIPIARIFRKPGAAVVALVSIYCPLKIMGAWPRSLFRVGRERWRVHVWLLKKWESTPDGFWPPSVYQELAIVVRIACGLH